MCLPVSRTRGPQGAVAVAIATERMRSPESPDRLDGEVPKKTEKKTDSVPRWLISPEGRRSHRGDVGVTLACGQGRTGLGLEPGLTRWVRKGCRCEKRLRASS